MSYKKCATSCAFWCCMFHCLVNAELAEPIPIMVNDKQLDVEHRGNAAPFFGDFDHDGKNDLLIGEYYSPERSRLRIYSNIGFNHAPKFDKFISFRKGEIAFRNTTFRPQLVDFDHDGKNDIVTANWPMQVSWFRREENGFSNAIQLKDKDGNAIRFGWIYSAFVIDWDLDGDLDVIVGGSVEGSVGSVFVLKQIDDQKLRFREPEAIKIGEKPILFQAGNVDVAVADWNQDSRRDLVVGLGDGSVVWLHNKGSNQVPSFEQPKTLIKPTKDIKKRGRNARICVADWNEDGRLDLLVGDAGDQFVKELDKNELEMRDAATQKKQIAFERWAEYYQKFRSIRTREKLSDQLRDRFTNAAKQGMQESKRAINQAFFEQQTYKPGKQTHGRVWVYLRQ